MQNNLASTNLPQTESDQMLLLQQELLKQQKRHKRVLARHQKAKDKMREEADASLEQVSNIEWEIACIHFKYWQETGCPDWGLLLALDSSSYYYQVLIQLIKQLNQSFLIMGGDRSINQYVIQFHISKAFESDGTAPDIQPLMQAMYQIIPFLKMDMGHKHCPETVSFSVWHPNTDDFHLEVAINPKTDECFLVQHVYMRVASCHRFSYLRECLLYIKHHHGIDAYGDESIVMEEQPLQVIQATRGTEEDSHAE